MFRMTAAMVSGDSPSASIARFPDGMAEAAAEGNDQFLGAGDAKDNAGAIAVHSGCGVQVSGIGQGHFRHQKAEKLGGVGGGHGLGRDAEGHRVETNRRNETAAGGVHMVGPGRIGVVVIRW
jgi:hypothetical protein